MTANNFSQALKNVLVHEGGYVNHPKDPGGATNQGITQAVYDSYRKALGKAVQSVKLINPAERDAIYRQRYWDIIKGDDLPSGVDYVVFDGGVNSGNVQSGKWLQRALGNRYSGSIDGMIGPETIRAVKEHPNHDQLVANICEQRMKFLRALKTFPTFGKGWTARVDGVKRVAQQWATGDVGKSPAKPVDIKPVTSDYVGVSAEPETAPKAVIADAQTAPSRAPGDITTGAAGFAGLAAISGYLSDALDKLTPYQDLPIMHKIVAGVTVGSVLVAGAGVAYRLYASRKRAQLADALNTGG